MNNVDKGSKEGNTDILKKKTADPQLKLPILKAAQQQLDKELDVILNMNTAEYLANNAKVNRRSVDEVQIPEIYQQFTVGEVLQFALNGDKVAQTVWDTIALSS